MTIETTDAATYQLLSSGRFAHRPGYIEDMGRGSFVLRHQEPTMIRLEANRPVEGALMVLEQISRRTFILNQSGALKSF